MPAEILTRKPATPAPSPSLGSVLIVDDEEQNRLLLRDPLAALGYEIAEAENGVQALQIAADDPPDVVLLDVMMPKMDGFEVCRRLKQYWKSAHVPILLVTALSDRKERLMGIEAGANDFLNKPVDLQDVILRVRNAVHTKRLFDQLEAEKEKSERLLLNILPKHIAERMKLGEVNIADSHADATVLFADLVDFTLLTDLVGAEQMVYLLNELFSVFDALAEKHGLEKIKTVGDAYVVAAGIPAARTDHVEAIAALALDMQDELERFNQGYNTSIRMRIGISTGPIVAGVIGRKKFAYDLWGVTVNIASRLEAMGAAGGIQVSESTYERLKESFHFEKKHTVNIRGRGEVAAYWLRRDQPARSRLSPPRPD